jgi:ankyrin repeat protein
VGRRSNIIKAALGAAFFVVWSGAMTAAAHAEGGPARALLAAATKGDIAGIRQLLSAGVKVDVRDGAGRTPLLLATHANTVEAARVLIGAGADVNARDNIQDSPYLYAGAEGRNEILAMTLAAGADLKSVNRYGGTALIPAAHHGHPETVKILLATAIDKDHVNKLGWTALLEAVILGDGGKTHTDIVKLLVDAGANVNIADRQGVTALQHARRSGYRQMIAILEAAGAR